MAKKVKPIQPKFGEGEIVYLITDPLQMERIVTGYYVRGSEIKYYLGHGADESHYYDFEIASDKDWKK